MALHAGIILSTGLSFFPDFSFDQILTLKTKKTKKKQNKNGSTLCILYYNLLFFT